MANPRYGICSICGTYDKLTKEHFPPKKAFNQDDYIVHSIDLHKTDRTVVWKRSVKQGGHFEYVSCVHCNNITGHWYADHYNEFAELCQPYARPMNVGIGGFDVAGFYPLRVVKQVMAMMLVSSSPENNQRLSTFSAPRDEKPNIDVDVSLAYRYRSAIRDFVLNRDAVGIPKPLRLYMYIVANGAGRKTGIGVMNTHNSEGILMSQEFAWWPLGWILVYDGEPDVFLSDVTGWAELPYNAKAAMEILLRCYWIASNYPLDFASPDELEARQAKNLTRLSKCNPDHPSLD